MQFSFKIRDGFYEDVNDAFKWYEKHQINLDLRLGIQIENALRFISKQPFANRIIKKDYRQQRVGVFPYVIMYKVYGNQIVVYSLFHNRRNPRKKFNK